MVSPRWINLAMENRSIFHREITPYFIGKPWETVPSINGWFSSQPSETIDRFEGNMVPWTVVTRSAAADVHIPRGPRVDMELPWNVIKTRRMGPSEWLNHLVVYESMMDQWVCCGVVVSPNISAYNGACDQRGKSFRYAPSYYSGLQKRNGKTNWPSAEN